MNNNNIDIEQNEQVVVNVQKIKVTITKKDAVIFCRVSSYGQTGYFHISFEVQEHKGHVCANLFGLKVMQTVKVVESAYDGKSCTIKSLISKNRGKNIIIYNVSRFSRNVDRGMELLDFALRHNTRLFFVEEGIVWDKNHTAFRDRLRERLHLAEQESVAIGRRVKDALAEKKRRGFFTGGKPKYGFEVVTVEGGRKAVPLDTEQNVIQFINMCRQVGTSVNDLNRMMSQISPNFDSPIVLGVNNSDGNKIKKVTKIVEPMSYICIANLLNDYGVVKRQSQWTSSAVSEIVRRDYEEALGGLEDMEIGF